MAKRVRKGPEGKTFSVTFRTDRPDTEAADRAIAAMSDIPSTPLLRETLKRHGFQVPQVKLGQGRKQSLSG